MSVSGSSLAHSRCLLICHIRINFYSSGRGRPQEHGMLNRYAGQQNVPGVEFSNRQGLSTMDRTTHLHLSSCGRTSKFLDIPGAKRMQSLLSLPRINCCFRTEKASHLKKRKLASSSSSGSYFDVYGDGHGCVSTSEGTVLNTPQEQTLHQAGSSRVLAAWKKIQSWSPTKPKSEALIREGPISVRSSGARNDHDCGLAEPVSRIKGSCHLKTRKYIRSPTEAYVGQSRDFHLSRPIAQPSSKRMDSRRQLAVAAITQALTPSLQPRRLGQGELGLRMANFLLSFMASAQTNETRFCEERVRKSLENMLRKTEAAEREVIAIQSWINDAENQLHAMPSDRDIERLEALLDNVLCHSVADKSVQEKRDEFLRAASNLKYILSNMHTVAEIQELQQEFEVIDKELTRSSDSSKEAVNHLRSAIARGEVAWLQNMESGAAYLEAMARTVLPLEGLYTTNF
ncbi:hypothetical protein M758_8G092000 [Ceratodon purpureus]|nr:hypothetical protein M758_8G092000 [Ceratodon purpureus]